MSGGEKINELITGVGEAKGELTYLPLARK